MLQLGPHSVAVLEDGAFALDGGAMFSVVPKPLWEQQLPADEQNRVPLALRCLLVRTGGRTVVVDTGMGDKWQGKAVAQFALSRERTLLTALAANGVSPAEVTDVVLTHLHFDHAGGVTRRADDGALALTFPNARHYVQRRNWDWAHSPTERDRGSYRAENFAALEGSDRLALLDGPCEVLPGLSVFLSEGHTTGLQLVRLDGGDRPLFYCADLIPTAAHLRPAWGMSYDLHPLTVIEEKRALLGAAVREGAVVVFEHDPHRAAATLREERGEIVLDREVTL